MELTGKCKDEFEKWMDVHGYDGVYSISSIGRIKSNDRVVKNGKATFYNRKGKILKPSQHLNDYLFIRLCINGRQNTHKGFKWSRSNQTS